MKNILYILFTILIISACNDFDIEDQGFNLEALPESVSFNAPGDDWDASTSGAEGSSVTLSVEAAAGTLADIEVTYSLGGTAEFGVDYTIAGATATGGTVTIVHDPADFNDFDMGEISISLLNDNINDTDTIVVTLISAVRDGEPIAVGRGGTEFGSIANIAITNDPLEFSLSASTINRDERAVGDTIQFIASINFASDLAVTYDLTSDGTLVAGTNFNYVTGSLTPGTGLSIAAGETADTVTIVLIDNAMASTAAEGLDSIQFEIENITIADGDIAEGNTTTTIFVQDEALGYGFGMTSDTVSLSQVTTYNYTVSLSDTLSNATVPALSDVTIPYTVNTGDAVENTDFEDVTGGSITILAEESSAVISIRVLRTGEDPAPTVTVVLGAATTSYGEIVGVSDNSTLNLQIN